jgi:hypothetical protein
MSVFTNFFLVESVIIVSIETLGIAVVFIVSYMIKQDPPDLLYVAQEKEKGFQ